MHDTATLDVFIRELEIESHILTSNVADAAPTAGGEGSGDPKKRAGYISGGSLVAFAPGIDPQHRDDVLNSTLFAQLVANKKFKRAEQPIAWYEAYTSVLGKIGWVIQDFSFHKFDASGPTLHITDCVLQILKETLDPSAYSSAVAIVNALMALSATDDKVEVFKSQSVEPGNGNFQIGLAAEAEGVVTMKVAAFYFSSKQRDINFLWISYQSSDVELYSSTQTMTLNPVVYSTVRQGILEKLGATHK
jgi:hypothetical protein